MLHAGAFCFVFWADLDAPFIADAHLVSDVAPVKMAFAEKNLRNLDFWFYPAEVGTVVPLQLNKRFSIHRTPISRKAFYRKRRKKSSP